MLLLCLYSSIKYWLHGSGILNHFSTICPMVNGIHEGLMLRPCLYRLDYNLHGQDSGLLYISHLVEAHELYIYHSKPIHKCI